MIYKNISKCRLCSSKKLKKILDLKKQPPANSLKMKQFHKEHKIPLITLHCSNCKTVQLSSTVNPKYLFNHYLWVTNTSISAKKYSKIFCDRILKKTNKNSFIVEIASNDGTFLKPFLRKKKKILGIDPAKNIARLANKNGIRTLPVFFNSKCAKKIVKKYSKADIVFARNVIPHVREIKSILKGMSELLTNKGTAIIEFHYAKIIQDELHYDSIYHEHLFYFTIETISKLFIKYGLYPYDVDKSPISGGSLVLYFSKTKNKVSPKLQKLIQNEKSNKVNEYFKWKKFAVKSIIHSKKLRSKIQKLVKKNNVIGYGASARSSTLLNFCQINENILNQIVDKNKLKKNKFTPGTNIKIIDYEQIKNDIKNYKIIFVLAWNFKREIMRDLKKIGYRGKYLLPLPNKIQFI